MPVVFDATALKLLSIFVERHLPQGTHRSNPTSWWCLSKM